jgi:hypothetical protein
VDSLLSRCSALGVVHVLDGPLSPVTDLARDPSRRVLYLGLLIQRLSLSEYLKVVSVVHLCSGDEVQSGVTMVIVVVRDKLFYPTPCGGEIGPPLEPGPLRL